MEVVGERSGDRSSAILIYTDGACFPNPGRGGWGARIVYSDGTRDELQGSASGWTTSSRMEMTAVVMGLRAVTRADRPVIVRSDSQFVIRTLCGRYRRHKNFDLWKDIDREVARFSRIRFEWLRGHAGDVHNEAADKLANAGAAQARDPHGAPPPPTSRTASAKREVGACSVGRSRLRCSRCNSPVRRRRRFPGQLRCRCGFTRRPELQNGGKERDNREGAGRVPGALSATGGREGPPVDDPARHSAVYAISGIERRSNTATSRASSWGISRPVRALPSRGWLYGTLNIVR